MSAAAAAPAEGEAPKKGSKKLIIIIAAVLLLVVLGGGGALFMMKKNAAAAAAAEGDDGEAETSHAKEAPKPKHSGKEEHGTPPAFVPLDPFVVNLADRDTERFAQVGLTLQVDDPKMAEEIKTYMPAIRNAVLMTLSHKTSDQLLSQEGKEKLAEELRREAARAMGYEIDEPDDEDAPPKEDADEAPKKKKKKKKKVEQYNPIMKVNYANFIVQ